MVHACALYYITYTHPLSLSSHWYGGQEQVEQREYHLVDSYPHLPAVYGIGDYVDVEFKDKKAMTYIKFAN